jgi:hypothetical protein
MSSDNLERTLGGAFSSPRIRFGVACQVPESGARSSQDGSGQWRLLRVMIDGFGGGHGPKRYLDPPDIVLDIAIVGDM